MSIGYTGQPLGGGGAISAMWIGGPQDGSYERLRGRGPIRVIAGTKENPEYRTVTPKQLPTGKWIINFYEGEIEE
jgi:hypothetical protein